MVRIDRQVLDPDVDAHGDAGIERSRQVAHGGRQPVQIDLHEVGADVESRVVVDGDLVVPGPTGVASPSGALRTGEVEGRHRVLRRGRRTCPGARSRWSRSAPLGLTEHQVTCERRLADLT